MITPENKNVKLVTFTLDMENINDEEEYDSDFYDTYEDIERELKGKSILEKSETWVDDILYIVVWYE